MLPDGTIRSPAPAMGTRAKRTVALILATARQLFLERGYGGTRMDDVADAAGISRASVYTYFPSKHDILIALGGATHDAANEVIGRFERLAADGCTPVRLASWVTAYLAYLDEHGSFLTVWYEANSDEDVRRSGLRAAMSSGQRLGRAIHTVRGDTTGEATLEGLAVLSLLERTWYFSRVGGMLSLTDAAETLTAALGAVLRRVDCPDVS